ncbi:MAG: hypothetical protein DMG57_05450 [Acidobacteria bacterium]|nr:MAG: hypothetical protein DMG57_05450 [Acidobacteriota bacterium]
MRLADELFLRLRSLFRRHEVEHELDAELRFHLEQQIAENIAAGMTPEEARFAARRKIGALVQIKGECREERRVDLIENWIRDLRYALRLLSRNPSFTAVAVMTLAMGIGANTAIFSVVRSIVFHSLPFRDPERLVWIRDDPTVLSVTFQSWRRMSSSFDALAAFNAFFNYGAVNWTGHGEPQRLSGVAVSQNLFPMLGVEAAVGRTFRPGEDQPGGPPVVVLTHGFWQRSFGSDPSAIGKVLTLNGKDFNVVGVLPASFDFAATFSPGARVDIFMPLILDKFSEEMSHYLGVIGRLRGDVTVARAQSEMDALTKQLKGRDPTLHAVVVPLQEAVVGEVRTPLLVLMSAAAFVLLIACTNLANLLLARGTARRREMAVRAALGAGLARLVRQLMTENILLALLGGAVGMLPAFWLVPFIRTLPNLPLPRLSQVRIDVGVLSFTVVASIVTGILFGLVPAVQVYGSAITDPLKKAGRSLSAGKHRVRDSLVIAEVALALVLLAGAGLLIRSFWHLLQVNPGFRAEGVIAVGIDPGGQKYGWLISADRGRRLVRFFDEIRRNVAAIPGVEAVALSDSLPLDRDRGFYIRPAGRTYRGLNETPLASIHVVTSAYFRVMGVPLKRGRTFMEQDTADSAVVMLVNETMARNLWPGEDVLGQFAEIAGRKAQVVGLIGDVRHSALDQQAGNEAYLLFAQYPYTFMDLVVRTNLEPGALAPAIRKAVWAVDRDQPLAQFRTIQQIIDRTLSPRRFSMMLLAAFAGLAIVLASVGTYGVMAYSVAQRTHEIGIRMALGAEPVDAVRLVVGHGVTLAGIGVVVGLAGALALTRWLGSQLYGVSPADPLNLLGVAALLVSVVALASYLPARRASRIDPMVALRYE